MILLLRDRLVGAHVLLEHLFQFLGGLQGQVNHLLFVVVAGVVALETTNIVQFESGNGLCAFRRCDAQRG